MSLTPNQTPAIQIAHVSKKYAGGTQALEDVSLEVENGEFVAVLGVSGCGKSTLLRIVAGLDTCTSGTVAVMGKEPSAARRDRDFGMVFQDPSLLPWRSVRRNVAIPAEIFRDREVLARVPEWIERVGLCGFEDALPSQLSGGMRSRVAIARALVFRPRVLMMDEPFGALDELTRADMHRELLGLWNEYRPTVVFVTHSVAEALFLADRVVVMSPRPGRIVAQTPVPFARPRSDHVRYMPEFARLGDTILQRLRDQRTE